MNSPAPKKIWTLDRTLLIGCLVVLAFPILYPTIRLVWSAVTQWHSDVFREGAGRQAVINTLFICFASVVTSGCLGTALAFLVSRFSFPGRRPLAGLAYLPFALPPLVGTLSFYYLIGDDGFIPRGAESFFRAFDPFEYAPLGGPLYYLLDGEALVPPIIDTPMNFSITGPVAILLIHTYSFSVFFYAMVSAALEGMDHAQVEAARTLGASPARAFWKVTVPMLIPALVGASLLTFMSSGASFSAPYFFGDDFPFLSVEIYKETSQFHQAEALTLTVVLACISLLGVGLFRSRKITAGSASKGVPREIRSAPGRFLAGGLAWGLIAVLLTPHLVITALSFVDHRQWYTELIPNKFTLDNYALIFNDPAAFRPIRNSLWMSLLAALGTVAVGLPAAYLIGRKRPGGRWINLLVMIPWALPGTVIAMNLITAFNDRWLPLYNTVWILPLAYFVRNVPLLTRMVTASISQFDVTLIEAARTLGASPSFCLRRVIVPLLAPALVAATALVFATGLGEFVSSILLFTVQNKPIALQINEEWRGSGIGSAFAYSVFLMILVTATFLVVRRFASRII